HDRNDVGVALIERAALNRLLGRGRANLQLAIIRRVARSECNEQETKRLAHFERPKRTSFGPDCRRALGIARASCIPATRGGSEGACAMAMQTCTSRSSRSQTAARKRALQVRPDCASGERGGEAGAHSRSALYRGHVASKAFAKVRAAHPEL